jgi:hypothetical protein
MADEKEKTNFADLDVTLQAKRENGVLVIL